MLRSAKPEEIPLIAAMIASHPRELLAMEDEWLVALAATASARVFVWDQGGLDGFAVVETVYPRVVNLINLGVSQNARGQGQGKALIRALLRHCFAEMNTHRLFCDIVFDNHVAMTAFEKAGLVREGTMRACWNREGDTWVDCHAYAMLADEWKQL